MTSLVVTFGVLAALTCTMPHCQVTVLCGLSLWCHGVAPQAEKQIETNAGSIRLEVLSHFHVDSGLVIHPTSVAFSQTVQPRDIFLLKLDFLVVH